MFSFEGFVKPNQNFKYTRIGTLIVATIYLQLRKRRYMLPRFTVLHCSHQHCIQPFASEMEVDGYLQQHLFCCKLKWSGLQSE